MPDVLIVEDHPDIAEGLRANLELEGYTVEIAGDGVTGLTRIREQPPELIILDLMLPELDGFHVLRRVRDEGFEMPVLILSARASEAEKIRGFRIGADDYVTKPFGLGELLARVEALYRRRRPSVVATPPSSLLTSFGDVQIHPQSRSVTRRGTAVSLRPKEFDLLEALARRAGRVASRQELLQSVWGYEADVQTRTVDTHIVELRRKLEDDAAEPRHIITVRKVGYLLRP
jgi:DNA-binding response OmpR family regulator